MSVIEKAAAAVAKQGIARVSDEAEDAIADAIPAARSWIEAHVEDETVAGAMLSALDRVDPAELVTLGRAKARKLLTKLAEEADDDVDGLRLLAFQRRRSVMRAATQAEVEAAEREANWLETMAAWAAGVGVVGRRVLPVLIAAL